MDDFIAITEDYLSVHLARRPVTLPEFLEFLREAKRPLPQGVRHAPANVPGGSEPVIGVTQLDATAYCEWASRRIGHACRLPSTSELDALMPHTTVSHAHEVVPDAGFWPHERGQLPELRGGLKPVFLCEWTRETEDAVSERDPDRIMARIFYPPWLRDGNNPLHVHASLQGSESYSFVTFRVSYEG